MIVNYFKWIKNHKKTQIYRNNKKFLVATIILILLLTMYMYMTQDVEMKKMPST